MTVVGNMVWDFTSHLSNSRGTLISSPSFTILELVCKHKPCSPTLLERLSRYFDAFLQIWGFLISVAQKSRSQMNHSGRRAIKLVRAQKWMRRTSESREGLCVSDQEHWGARPNTSTPNPRTRHLMDERSPPQRFIGLSSAFLIEDYSIPCASPCEWFL